MFLESYFTLKNDSSIQGRPLCEGRDKTSKI